MKKVLVGLLSAFMLMFIAGCSIGNGAVEGNWYIVSEGEITTLSLDDDGTGRLDSKDVTYEYKDEEIRLEISGQSDVVADVEDDDFYGMVMETSNDKIYAYQDKDEAKKAAEKQKEEIAEQQDANSVSAFIGTWEGVSASSEGKSINLDEADLEFSVDINSNKTVTATTNGESDGSGTWTYNSTTKKLTITDTTNATITCYISNGKLIFPLKYEDQVITFTMTKVK